MAQVTSSTFLLFDNIIRRIDASDIEDRLQVMRLQEKSYRCSNYFENNENSKCTNNPVDGNTRMRMCEWCYQVIDYSKFRREMVAIGMSYLDRYLCTSTGKNALHSYRAFQLATITALYIAIKTHESLEMDAQLLSRISGGVYEPNEIVAMEQNILTVLEWRVGGGISSYSFVQHYISLAPTSIHLTVMSAIVEYSQYQTELAVFEADLIDTLPSVIAFGAILNALCEIPSDLLPLKVQASFIHSIEKHSGMKVDDVLTTQCCLRVCLNYSDVSELEIKHIDYSSTQQALMHHKDSQPLDSICVCKGQYVH